jgi:hypothetical protein
LREDAGRTNCSNSRPSPIHHSPQVRQNRRGRSAIIVCQK